VSPLDFQPSEHLESVQIGQPNVENYGVRLLPRCAEAVSAIAALTDIEPSLAKAAHLRVATVGLVIDDQNDRHDEAKG